MAFDVGDTIPLVWQTVDASGQPANVGSASLVITLPDNSTVALALVNGSTGNYAPATPFVATQAGRHEVLWQGSGANAQANSDVFEVLASDPGLLISLAQARSSLGKLPGADVAKDEDLRSLIASATGPMEDICGAILAVDCDDWLDGGSSLLRLMDAPLIAVSSVVECYGAGYARTLTLQNLDAGSFDAYGYTVDLHDGTLFRRISGQLGPFAAGRRNVHVVYTRGRSVIPPNITRATRRLVRWLWQSEMQGGRPQGAQAEAVTVTPSGFAVPNAVIELCAAERRVVGMG